MKYSFFRNRMVGFLGNLLEHYDHALFGFLAPFVAPLFFDDKDPIVALLLTYAMLPLALLTRPLGSLYFGWIGDRWGRKSALFISLFGMGIATSLIGFLPLYKDVGLWAPIGLALARMMQSFFVAGEYTGAAIFVLEQAEASKKSLMSGFYNASSLAGILIASGLVTYMGCGEVVETYWRYLFWVGGATAILGVYFRSLGKESSPVFSLASRETFFSILKKYKVPFFSIFLASGFSYVTYSLSFTFMNGYIPLVTSFSKTDAMKMNTAFLFLDMILLPCFGFLADRWGKEKVMLLSALCSVAAVVPLFGFLPEASLFAVYTIRLAVIIPGIAFAAPYHAWAIEQVAASHRYLVLSLGYAFGSQLIGMPTSFICLWLYKLSGWSWAPGLYLMLAAIGAIWAIVFSTRTARQMVID